MKRSLNSCFAILIAIFTMFPASLLADDSANLKKDLPKLLGAGNAGTEFFMTFNPAWATGSDGSNIKIYVSSEVETEVTCEIKAKDFLETKTTIANSVIEFTLTPREAQCYSKSDRDPPEEEQVYSEFAVHIRADDPIVVYAFTRYQYTSDGFLALPVSSLGKNYIVASYADVGDNGTSFGQYMPSQTAVVAPFDGTKVKFTLGGPLHTKTYGGMAVGESTNIEMNKGDVWLVSSFGHAADLSGSKISADKPVAVVSSNYCANVPLDKAACDFLCEMELPTKAWGKKYHVTPVYPREKNSIVKVIALSDSITRLYRNGREISYFSASGGAENTGWMEIRLDEVDLQPWVYSADKPIGVTQYNPGQTYDGVVSDPFQMSLTPVEQYQTEIFFNTPGYPYFNDNYVNIAYLATPEGTIPNDVEIAKFENGSLNWMTLRSISSAPGDPLVGDTINDRIYYSKTLELDSASVYKLRADDPIAAYLYGFSNYESFGLPAGVALEDLQGEDPQEETHPVITTQDYDFGLSVGVESEYVKTGTVVFENLQWERADSLTISDFEVVAPGTITTDGYNYGSEGFVIDKKKIRILRSDSTTETHNINRSEIVLQPGEKVEIDVRFAAQKDGVHEASLRAVSDGWSLHDEYRDVSTWTGEGRMPKLDSISAEGQICVGESLSLFPKILNFGETDARVWEVELMYNDENLFQFADPQLAENGFDLPAGSEKSIEIIYTPKAPGGVDFALLLMPNNTINENMVTTTLKGFSDQYHRTTSSSVNKSEVNGDDSFLYRIFLDPASPEYPSSKDFALATVEQLVFTITYDGAFIQFDEAVDIISDFTLSDVKREIINQSENIWELTFSINFANVDNDINDLKTDEIVDLIEVNFTANMAYAARQAGSASAFSEITTIRCEVSTVANSDECIEFGPPSETQITINPSPVEEDDAFGEKSKIRVVPNPIGETGGEIEFFVEYPQAKTEIELCDANGRTVAFLAAGYFSAGAHRVAVPTRGLPSGVYWCKMRSGKYYAAKKLVIVK